MSEAKASMAGTAYRIANGALIVAAALAVVAAAIVAVGVIPDVHDIWVPQTEGSGGSTPAFWASVVANLLFSGIVAVTVFGGRLWSKRWSWLVLLLGAGAILQALMYLDASAAFHGPLEEAMEPARERLRYAIAADTIAGVLAIASVVWVAVLGWRARLAQR